MHGNHWQPRVWLGSKALSLLQVQLCFSPWSAGWGAQEARGGADETPPAAGRTWQDQKTRKSVFRTLKGFVMCHGRDLRKKLSNYMSPRWHIHSRDEFYKFLDFLHITISVFEGIVKAFLKHIASSSTTSSAHSTQKMTLQLDDIHTWTNILEF